MNTDITERLTTLWRVHYKCSDSCAGVWGEEGPEHQCYGLIPYAVTKITDKRIYFRDNGYDRSYFVDRSKIRDDGDGHGPHFRHRRIYESLYLVRPTWHLRQKPARPDLSQLRQEMAAAHPDRGGNRDSFAAARARYLRAKRGAA